MRKENQRVRVYWYEKLHKNFWSQNFQVSEQLKSAIKIKIDRKLQSLQCIFGN